MAHSNFFASGRLSLSRACCAQSLLRLFGQIIMLLYSCVGGRKCWAEYIQVGVAHPQRRAWFLGFTVRTLAAVVQPESNLPEQGL